MSTRRSGRKRPTSESTAVAEATPSSKQQSTSEGNVLSSSRPSGYGGPPEGVLGPESLNVLVTRLAESTSSLFASTPPTLPPLDVPSTKLRAAVKVSAEYSGIKHEAGPSLTAAPVVKPAASFHQTPSPAQSDSSSTPIPNALSSLPPPSSRTSTKGSSRSSNHKNNKSSNDGPPAAPVFVSGENDVTMTDAVDESNPLASAIASLPTPSTSTSGSTSMALVASMPRAPPPRSSDQDRTSWASANPHTGTQPSTSLARQAGARGPAPVWRAPWKLKRVIPGHSGAVRSIAVEPGNEWFATGAADRTIRIYDLASGTLRVTLTNHISTVRAVAISARSPYLFSASEDKKVLCWDLEANRVIRHYHGHLSGVYTAALHPKLDLLVTGGRDQTCRVWDIRSKQAVHVFGGHTSTVSAVVAQGSDPQVISGGMDSQVRLWDLRAGKCMATLTNHKKSVRALAIHPREFTFASGAPDYVKVWKCPEGMFLRNLAGSNAIVNALAINEDGTLVAGGDNGSLSFFDYATGYNYQSAATIVQPGSLDSEAGIFATTFDQSGTRLLTGEADKTIKVWAEDKEATPTSHPIVWRSDVAGKTW